MKKTSDSARIAMMVALMSICAWIGVPVTVPFTMQTFAVFCTVGLLGTKCAVATVITYVLLGTVGLPVFTGFVGGVGIFATVNGGFILGFIPTTLVCGILIKKAFPLPIAMGLGLAVCYIFGSAWFCMLHSASFTAALSACVLPYLPFDLIKIALAVLTVRKFKLWI